MVQTRKGFCMKKVPTLLSVVSLLALPLAACGSSSDSSTSSTAAATGGSSTSSTSSGGTASTVDISAAPDNSLAFEQKAVSAKAGDVTVDFNNPAQISHA